MNLPLLSLLAVLHAAPAQAESPEAAPKEAARPKHGSDYGKSIQLQGNIFIFPMLQDSAFVTTHVGIREGVVGLRVPRLPLSSLGTQDIEMSSLRQELDLGLRLTDWLGLSLTGRGDVQTGVDGDSLLANGAAFDLGADGGLVVRVLRLEHTGTQLSLRGTAGYSRGRKVTVFPLIQAILDTPGVTLDSIINGNLSDFLLLPVSEKSLHAGVYLAQAFGPVLSLQASAVGSYRWHKEEQLNADASGRTDVKTDVKRVDVAVALAVDFQSLHVPVAVMGEYQLQVGHRDRTGLDANTLATSAAAASVYYTGREDLQLGLGAVAVLNAEPLQGIDEEGIVRESGRPKSAYAQLILRYIW